MNNQHFSFPPPPPPPPQAANYYPPPPDHSRQKFNDRNNRGGAGQRGRGRGNSRGGTRGGYAGNLGHASSYGGHPQGGQRGGNFPNHQDNSYGGGHYPLPEYPQIQQPQYPPSPYNAYSQPAAKYPPPQPYPNPQHQPYASYPSNGHSSAPHYNAQHQNQPYGYGQPSHSGRPHPNGPQRQPMMMGPPIHIGLDGRPTDYRAAPYGSHETRDVNRMPLGNHSPRSSGSAQHAFQNPFPGRGKKRSRSEAFSQPRHSQSRPQAAPAVPSFGNPLPVDLPSKPLGSAANGKKRKKKRRHNQLGLTPKTEEHESSEEEDDQDEETQLAAAADGQLQFTYKGQTSTLQSPSQIAAWIADRKKKFPTQARAAEAAERKKRNQEEQRAARQAAKESQEKRKAEARAKQEEQQIAALNVGVQHASKDTDQPPSTAEETKATKAQSKLEKLRRRLEKEEKRIAKAQAKASKTDRSAAVSAEVSMSSNTREEQKPNSHTEVVNGIKYNDPTESLVASSEKGPEMLQDSIGPSAEQDTVNLKEGGTLEAPGSSDITTAEAITGPNPLTPTSQPSISDPDPAVVPNHLSIGDPEQSAEPVEAVLHQSVPSEDVETEEESSLSTSTDLSNMSSSSGDEDDTSSSGGSSSSDDAPETVTSKRTAPDKVPPPKRGKPKPKEICRAFLKSGRCFRGENCKFRHELPELGKQSKADKQMKANEPKKERKGLYQRLVDQEKEQQDQHILNTIVNLGERGLLAESLAQEGGDTSQPP